MNLTANVSSYSMFKRDKRSRENETENEQSQQTICDTREHDSGGESAYFSSSTGSRTEDETPWSSCENMLVIVEQEDSKGITAECLQMNYKYLKSEMEPLGVLDHFHSVDLFSDEFLENCKETTGRRRRNDLLIKKIHYIAQTRTSQVLQHFVHALQITQQDHIVKTLTEQSEPSDFWRHQDVDVKFIIEMRRDIVENIEPRGFIDDLLVSKAISFHDHEDIEGLNYRKDRIDFILKKAYGDKNSAMKIASAIINEHPELFKDYRLKTYYRSVRDKGNRLGTAVNIRLHLKTGSKLIRRKSRREHLRKIEKRIVETFDKSQPKNEVIENFIENCRLKFEGLRISSVVIQLLTEAGDSFEKVMEKIRSGEAVDWLLSLLEITDIQYLTKIGTTSLLVTVAVDEEGNFNNLQPVKECLCRLDQSTVLQNKERLAGLITFTDVGKLMKQIKSFGFKKPTLASWVPAEKQISAFLDTFTSADVPSIYFCLLEEHIKKIDPIFLSTIVTGGMYKDALLSKSHIKQHEQFLTEELEVWEYLPVIRLRGNETSIQFLAKLEKSQCRSSRVAEFLEFLHCEEDVTWFWEEVKKRQKDIWDSIMSSQRNLMQSKYVLHAVKMMHDKIVDEIDPLRLKHYMDPETTEKLRFHKFQNIPSRRTQAQVLLNWLSTDTINVFMTALRRCGYTHMENEIKAGSLAKEYVCPRVHQVYSQSHGKSVYEGLFEITAERLRVFATGSYTFQQSSLGYLKRYEPIKTHKPSMDYSGPTKEISAKEKIRSVRTNLTAIDSPEDLTYSYLTPAVVYD